MNDPLFNAAWPQAAEARRTAEIERRNAAAQRARSGELGAFRQAFQLEMDAWYQYTRRLFNGMSCDTIVFDEA